MPCTLYLADSTPEDQSRFPLRLPACTEQLAEPDEGPKAVMYTHLNPVQAGRQACPALISAPLPVTLILAEADGTGQLLQLLTAETLLLIAAQGGQLLQDVPAGQSNVCNIRAQGSRMVSYRKAKA